MSPRAGAVSGAPCAGMETRGNECLSRFDLAAEVFPEAPARVQGDQRDLRCFAAALLLWRLDGAQFFGFMRRLTYWVFRSNGTENRLKRSGELRSRAGSNAERIFAIASQPARANANENREKLAGISGVQIAVPRVSFNLRRRTRPDGRRRAGAALDLVAAEQARLRAAPGAGVFGAGGVGRGVVAVAADAARMTACNVPIARRSVALSVWWSGEMARLSQQTGSPAFGPAANSCEPRPRGYLRSDRILHPAGDVLFRFCLG